MRWSLFPLLLVLACSSVCAAPHPDISGFSAPENFSVDGLVSVFDTAVYRQAWYASDGDDGWTSLPLGGDAYAGSDDWLSGTATAALPAFGPGEHYVIVYSCSYTATWDCHGGWQLHVIDGALQENCSDGVQNQDETGVDCGGSCPDVCSAPVDGMQWSDELLTNPGFEEGSLNGWTASNPEWDVGDSPYSNEPVGDASEHPFEGSYCAFNGENSQTSHYLYQDVDLAPYMGFVVEGLAFLNASGWAVSAFDGDRTGIFIHFLDADRNIIAIPLDTGTIVSDDWWQGAVAEYPIPVGAKHVRVGGNSHSGPANLNYQWYPSGSLDAFSVKVGYTGTPCQRSCDGKECGDDGCGGVCGSCSYANAVGACMDFQCSLVSCDAGFDDCDSSDANGCERALGTLADCGSCGDACTGMQYCNDYVCTDPTCGDGILNQGEEKIDCGGVNCPACPDVTVYYVANDGTDGDGHGLSASDPWRTISWVNQQVLGPDTEVRFRRGDTWRETLQIRQSGLPGRPITYANYGSGPNPRILGSDQLTGWTQYSGSIWQASGSYDNPRQYYPGEVFFEDGGEVTWGVYRSSIGALVEEYEWTISGGTVYAYAPTDPDTRYDAVEINQRDRCIEMIDNDPQEHVVIDGIDLHYSRTEGFYGGYPEYAQTLGLTVRNCNIGYIGEKASGAAYGIHAWHSDMLVENNNFSDCGRRAISYNIYSAAEPGLYDNVTIRDNVFKRGYHTSSLDLSIQIAPEGVLLHDVYFYSNVIDDSDVRMEGNDDFSSQIFVQEGEGNEIDDVYIFNNVFIYGTYPNVNTEGGDTIHVWFNTFYGLNPIISHQAWSNVAFAYTREVDYRNNILVDTLPANDLDNEGVLAYHLPTVFTQKDYNLYYFPTAASGDRNFAAHRSNNCDQQQPGVSYWSVADWEAYKDDNSLYEQHSPNPGDPRFVDAGSFDLRLQSGSPAAGAGTPIAMVTTDILGNPRDPAHPSIGAYEFPG